eukprot:CAMPEP_0185853482 /NCGR_PEP_ID=MMETSP1354-20130828/19180_1 /TAXON_ID=708628 /ORGANISM="Erythrolobus madagascarensis, Strain CCMP3276" /LENGTH=182 /DNA_ID=CAMNT_0028554985 /DNA_START=52 /DNA_END=600 /DNA_ORIENTATION=+
MAFVTLGGAHGATRRRIDRAQPSKSRAQVVCSVQNGRQEPANVSKCDGAALTRRAILTNTAASVLSAAAMAGLLGVPVESATASALHPSFEGKYSDPKHPLCPRKVEVVKNGVLRITGEDGDPGCVPGGKRKSWKVSGKIEKDGSLRVNFGSKGGPKDLAGTFNVRKATIDWKDGNKWTKKF